jgi:tripartite motif-containing protein 71
MRADPSRSSSGQRLTGLSGRNPRRVLSRVALALRLPVVISLILVLSLLTGTASQSAVASTTITPVQLGTIPASPTNGHAGLYAWGAATMPDGSVIIGDYWNGRVVHYATDGTSLGVLFSLAAPGAPVTSNTAPYGLAVDQTSGVVYVGTYYVDPKIPSVVQRWAPDGVTGVYSKLTPISYSGFVYPSRVAVANDGRVYVDDMKANKVFVFNSAGTFQFAWGSTGSANGQFNQPRGMAFDQSDPQRLYIADANNKRVQVFSTSGTFLFKFGSGGTHVYNFKGNLRGLAIDTPGNAVYVVDINSDYVYKFDLAGNWLTNIGGPGGLDQTTCCSTPDGKFSDGGREATVDGNGMLWVGDMPNYRVQVFDSSGQFQFLRPSPPENPADGAFNAPRAVEVDSGGNVVVVDSFNQRFEKFDGTGSWLWSRGVRGSASGEFLNYPDGVATDPNDGSIVLADTSNNQIKKFDSTGVFLWQKGKGASTALGLFKTPTGVAVGPDGKVYVADTGNARVQVFNGSDGAFLYAFGARGTTGGNMSGPTGLTVDQSNQNVYVADPPRHLVLVYTNTGTFLRAIGSPTLKRDYDVAVDATSVYVSDRTLNKFVIFNKSDGTLVGSYGGTGSGPGKVLDPQGIGISSDGKLYITDVKNDRVQVWCVTSACGA